MECYHVWWPWLWLLNASRGLSAIAEFRVSRLKRSEPYFFQNATSLVTAKCQESTHTQYLIYLMWSETSVLWQDRSQASKTVLVLVLHLQIWSCTVLRLQSLWWAFNRQYRMNKYKKNHWPAVHCCLLPHLATVWINSIITYISVF